VGRPFKVIPTSGCYWRVRRERLLGEIRGTGRQSKTVTIEVDRLVAALGPELHILCEADIAAIRRAAGGMVAEAITRLRKGEVIREAGYDGEYGVVRLFRREELSGTEAMFGIPARAPMPLPAGPAESAIAERVEAALRIISAFSGLAQENMTQLAGWRFLELGRRIERALLTCRLTRAFAAPDAPDGSLDLLLELADSQISYRQRYVMIAALAPVIDLVMLDPNNPRSVEFQLDRIETHLDALPKQNAEGRLSPAQQIAASIATRLRTINANAVDTNLIVDIENSLMKLSDAIGASFLTSNERTEVTWEALA